MTLLCFLALGLLAQPADTADITRELEGVEQEIARTWKNGECEAWSALVASEWSVVHITGAVMSKADVLRQCADPAAKLDVLTTETESVRLFGDTAVGTGRTTASTAGPSAQTVVLRFTDVFVHRSGRWQAVASQATRLAR